jgi:ArsR family transcriptional regulator, virulence genes transcriptional regulator
VNVIQAWPDRKAEEELCRLQADFCKGMSHPKRIEILNILKGGQKSVNELVIITGIPQANLSQHLGVLRHFGLLEAQRSGSKVCYRIADHRIVEACELVREAIGERAKKTRIVLDATR